MTVGLTELEINNIIKIKCRAPANTFRECGVILHCCQLFLSQSQNTSLSAFRNLIFPLDQKRIQAYQADSCVTSSRKLACVRPDLSVSKWVVVRTNYYLL